MKSLKARTLALAAALAVLLLAGVGATTAYIHRSVRLTNVFELAAVNVDVSETFDGTTTKEDVAIENTADTPVYIRATLLIAWTDGNERVLADIPQANIDYTLTAARTGWVRGTDGYYYYTKPVSPHQKTSNLLDTLTKLYTGTDKILSVTIAAQAVQATPREAVCQVWGATVDENTGVLTPGGEVSP